MRGQRVDRRVYHRVCAGRNLGCSAPIELARHLVLGAVDYARGLGFEPHQDFWATAGHLGSLDGPCAIEFDNDGEPFYVEGPHDDSLRNMHTLERSVGEHNFGFIVTALWSTRPWRRRPSP